MRTIWLFCIALALGGCGGGDQGEGTKTVVVDTASGQSAPRPDSAPVGKDSMMAGAGQDTTL